MWAYKDSKNAYISQVEWTGRCIADKSRSITLRLNVELIFVKYFSISPLYVNFIYHIALEAGIKYLFVYIPQLEWTGRSITDKLEDTRQKLRDKHCTALVLTALDDIACES